MTTFTIDRDSPVPTRDGTVLRADVFRPSDPGSYPVILTHGPYGKDIHFSDFNAHAYGLVSERGRYMNWETVNPDRWVPEGYVVVRVDQRGTGASPGTMDLFSAQEFVDYYDAIEWAGTQEWSNGKVGLLGISYYAIGQWFVAGMRPRHLAAIVPWEGASDLYREFHYHAGLLSNTFADAWWPRQITGNQSALEAGADNPNAAIGDNVDLPQVVRQHPLLDEYWDGRTADLAAIDVPLLSAGNWASYNLHLRGNIEGWLAAGTEQKWLEIHTGNHFAPFYAAWAQDYQQRFLDRWLKGDEAAWPDSEPRIRFMVRCSDGTIDERTTDSWPLASTTWTPFHLDAASGSLTSEAVDAGEMSFATPTGSATFFTSPMTDWFEFSGPIVLRLTVASTTEDADLFVTLFDLGPDGQEVHLEDASGNQGPITKGWLRLSHRALDEQRSTDWRPVHVHRQREPLTPGEVVDVDVEVMATSMRLGPGHRLGMTIGAADRREQSRFAHNDPVNRDPKVFADSTTTIYTGGDRPSALVLPVIPLDQS